MASKKPPDPPPEAQTLVDLVTTADTDDLMETQIGLDALDSRLPPIVAGAAGTRDERAAAETPLPQPTAAAPPCGPPDPRPTIPSIASPNSDDASVGTPPDRTQYDAAPAPRSAEPSPWPSTPAQSAPETCPDNATFIAGYSKTLIADPHPPAGPRGVSGTLPRPDAAQLKDH